MENIDFNLILDNGETLVKTIKPNKKRYITIDLIFKILMVLIFGVGFITIGIVSYFTNPEDPQNTLSVFTSLGAVFSFIFISSAFYNVVTYKKTIYAITDRRLIIKSGFIGSDFKSLELSSIGAVSVRVDLLDKLITPTNSGTVCFGSMSMPMSSVNGQANSPSFSFKHIDNPYDIYKEVKEAIAKTKQEIK